MGNAKRYSIHLKAESLTPNHVAINRLMASDVHSTKGSFNLQMAAAYHLLSLPFPLLGPSFRAARPESSGVV